MANGICDIVWPFVSFCDLTGESPIVTGAALAAASEVLDALSGRQFGECQLVIRPCRSECSGDTWRFIDRSWWEYGQWPRPLFYNGVWYNVTCGACSGHCSCTELQEVRLPDNVITIDEVKVDGVVLDPSAYRVDNFRILVRIDGGTWPICNELNNADTEVGTWSITATYGKAVPQLGQIAVGELMCEFVNLLTDNGKCKLPMPTQSLVRQGITMNFLDPTTIFDNGRVGLYISDLFVTTFNPKRIMQAAQVFDVDAMQRHRIVGTA